MKIYYITSEDLYQISQLVHDYGNLCREETTSLAKFCTMVDDNKPREEIDVAYNTYQLKKKETYQLSLNIDNLIKKMAKLEE